MAAKAPIKTGQEIAAWCNVKTTCKRQKKLAETARKPGGCSNALAYVEAEEPADVPQEPTPAEAAAPQWFQDFVNPLGSGNGKGGGRSAAVSGKGGGNGTGGNGAKGPRITFRGCWHCGKEGHS